MDRSYDTTFQPATAHNGIAAFLCGLGSPQLARCFQSASGMRLAAVACALEIGYLRNGSSPSRISNLGEDTNNLSFKEPLSNLNVNYRLVGAPGEERPHLYFYGWDGIDDLGEPGERSTLGDTTWRYRREPRKQSSTPTK